MSSYLYLRVNGDSNTFKIRFVGVFLGQNFGINEREERDRKGV